MIFLLTLLGDLLIILVLTITYFLSTSRLVEAIVD